LAAVDFEGLQLPPRPIKPPLRQTTKKPHNSVLQISTPGVQNETVVAAIQNLGIPSPGQPTMGFGVSGLTSVDDGLVAGTCEGGAK
jgi:hypothetical protein